MKKSMAMVVLVAAGMSGVIVAGCNIVAPAYLLVKGPPKIEAQHTLEEPRPTIVFIDDRLPVLGRRPLRNMIAEAAQSALLEQGVLVNMIDYRAGVAIADREAPGQPTDIVTLAKTAQAEVVIFATVDSFSLTPDRQNLLPSAVLRVKVLDVSKDSPRVWPAEAEGFPLVVQPSQRATPLPTTPTDIMRAENAFAGQVGLAIAQLFYSHEAREPVNAAGK